MNRLVRLIAIISFVGIVLQGCIGPFAPSPYLPTKEEVARFSSDSMSLVRRPFDRVIIEDDLSSDSLREAIVQSLVYLNRIPSDQVFRYGSIEYSAAEIIDSCLLFQSLISQELDSETLAEELEKRFYLFESTANRDNQVLFTGYFEPIYPGSLVPDPEYPVPVYSLPDDLNVLELDDFRDSLRNRTIVYRLEDNRILPYYSRQEIMAQNALAGRGLEIAWMKSPVDLLFLQIQGSGILELPSKEKVKLAYAGANGHNYSSIGALLIDEGKMILEDVSMESIREYLDTHEEERDRIIYHNKSYVFFTFGDYDGHPRGSINVPLTPLRSIATDLNLFPKAAIGFIKTEVPTFDPLDWRFLGTKKIARFIVNQDTGGAIKGTGRTDLFWGNGKLAEKSAGKMRGLGKLYFIVAKKDHLPFKVKPFPVSN